MIRHLKYRPYIRKHKRGDRADGFRARIDMTLYRIIGKPFYVMVQRGFPHDVMAAAPSRAKLEQSFMWLQIYRKYGARFKDYAKRLQVRAAEGRHLPDYKPRFRAARVPDAVR